MASLLGGGEPELAALQVTENVNGRKRNYNWYLLTVRSDPLHFYGFFFFFFGVAILSMAVGVCVKTSSYDHRIFYFSL